MAHEWNTCRYDHVIKAIRALQSYAGVCAEDVDTRGLLGRAKEAIMALEKIEAKLPHRSPSGKAFLPASSIAEDLKRVVDRAAPHIERAEAILSLYAVVVEKMTAKQRADINPLVPIMERIVSLGSQIRDTARLMDPAKQAREI